MYAHMDQVSRPGHQSGGQDPAGPGTDVAGQPGLLGSVTMQQLAGPAAVCLTWWDSEAGATAFAGQRAARPAQPGDIYEVAEAEQGPAAAEIPGYARLLYFDGPRAPEQVAAADLAGRQRIWPAIRSLSGLVGVYVLRGPDLGYVVVTLATSVETLEAAQRAVMATELMPGEDPALLPGPDRIEIHRVTGYDASAAGQAASAQGLR